MSKFKNKEKIKIINDKKELQDALNNKIHGLTLFLEWVIWLVDDNYLMAETDEFCTFLPHGDGDYTMITTRDEDIEKYDNFFGVVKYEDYLRYTAREKLLFKDDETLNVFLFDKLEKQLTKFLYMIYTENESTEAVKKEIYSLFSDFFKYYKAYTPDNTIKQNIYKRNFNCGNGYGDRIINHCEYNVLDNKPCYFTLACDVLHSMLESVQMVLSSFNIDLTDVFNSTEINDFCSLYDYEISKIEDNRQNNAQRSDKLPPELSTSEAMEIWKKAQKAGLVDEQYKWLKTKVLLACFAKEMSDRFNLGKGTNSDGSKRINWKIFENLFDILGLRGALNDLKKTGENPLNINLVSDIFK